MTDNDIIKALKVCDKYDFCDNCPYSDECHDLEVLHKNALDLINRQKAQIERLKGEIGSLNKKYPCTVDVGNNCLVYARSLDDYDKLIGDISAEAVKEFEDRVKAEYTDFDEKYETILPENINKTIDDLLAEAPNGEITKNE